MDEEQIINMKKILPFMIADLNRNDKTYAEKYYNSYYDKNKSIITIYRCKSGYTVYVNEIYKRKNSISSNMIECSTITTHKFIYDYNQEITNIEPIETKKMEDIYFIVLEENVNPMAYIHYTFYGSEYVHVLEEI